VGSTRATHLTRTPQRGPLRSGIHIPSLWFAGHSFISQCRHGMAQHDTCPCFPWLRLPQFTLLYALHGRGGHFWALLRSRTPLPSTWCLLRHSNVHLTTDPRSIPFDAKPRAFTAWTTAALHLRGHGRRTPDGFLAIASTAAYQHRQASPHSPDVREYAGSTLCLPEPDNNFHLLGILHGRDVFRLRMRLWPIFSAFYRVGRALTGLTKLSSGYICAFGWTFLHGGMPRHSPHTPLTRARPPPLRVTRTPGLNRAHALWCHLVRGLRRFISTSPRNAALRD